MPEVGNVTALEKEQQRHLFAAGQSARLEKESTASGEINKSSTSADAATCAGSLLSVRDVTEASPSQAALWASTRDVIWAMLAAACRQEGNSRSSTPEAQRSVAESAGASCAGARGAACALLARVFGSITAGEEEETGQKVTGIGEKEASIALDWWYEGFCSATAPPCGGGGSSLLLYEEEAPRLLLEEMLEIPSLKAAFVKRGLTRHLADALRVGSAEMRNREVGLCRHTHVRSAPGGIAPSCGMNKPPEKDPDTSSARAPKGGGKISPRHCSCDANGKANLPWWLLFNQGRGESGGGGHGHGFSETLQKLVGGTDGVGTEADGRSCQTALDEIFAPERGKEERGADTSREDDPTDSNSLGSYAGGMPVVSAMTAKQRECRELKGVADGSTAVGGGANSTKTGGRVAPPMLRLDALGSILDTEECASARLCPSHAVGSLSAASTRAASEHLVRGLVFQLPVLSCRSFQL